MTASRLTFRKARHLCSRRAVDALFAGGNASAMAFPLRAVWRWEEATSGAPFRLLVVAPKRRLRHAVDRNRAKRQMREALRLTSPSLPTVEGRALHLAVLWVSDKPVYSARVAYAVETLIEKIRSASPQP